MAEGLPLGTERLSKEKEPDKVSSIVTKTDPEKEKPAGAASCAVRVEAAVLGWLQEERARAPRSRRIQAQMPPRRLKDTKMFVFLFLRNNDGLFLNKTLLGLTFIL